MTVHFYDVGEGLAALVDLPDGRHVLVDAGDYPRRRGCEECRAESSRLMRALRTDLRGEPIDVLWITHQHSDHLGGAPGVLSGLKVGAYVDNGRDAGKAEVRRAHEAAREHGVSVHVVDPRRPTVPLAASENVTLRAVLSRAQASDGGERRFNDGEAQGLPKRFWQAPGLTLEPDVHVFKRIVMNIPLPL